MRYVCLSFVYLLFLGCSPMVKVGDYVTYTSDEYVFIENSFIDRSIDCIELGKLKQGDLDVKYCVGENYASQLVQGFMFEHHFEDVSERFIGATLSFKTKRLFTIACSSETIEGTQSGKEYINCMVPRKTFDLYSFIMNSNKDVQGIFTAAVGDNRVYNGVIDNEGKALLHKFYKDREENTKSQWKNRSL